MEEEWKSKSERIRNTRGKEYIHDGYNTSYDVKIYYVRVRREKKQERNMDREETNRWLSISIYIEKEWTKEIQIEEAKPYQTRINCKGKCIIPVGEDLKSARSYSI